MEQWEFTNDNVQRLWKRMNPVDRIQFDLDVGSLDWRDFSYRHVRGVRAYLLKDPLDTVPQGRARYFKYKRYSTILFNESMLRHGFLGILFHSTIFFHHF